MTDFPLPSNVKEVLSRLPVKDQGERSAGLGADGRILGGSALGGPRSEAAPIRIDSF